MSDVFASLLIVIATVLSVVFLVPQTVRLARTGDASGLSATWPVLGLVLNSGWIVYLAQEGLLAAALTMVVLQVPYGFIAWKLWQMGRSFRAPLQHGAVAVAAVVSAALLAGWNGVGAALGVSYAVQLSPAVWAAYRTWAPSGIEPRTWLLGVAEGVLWGAYGWHHGDDAVQLFGGVAIVGSTLILGRYYFTRHRLDVADSALPAPW